MRTDARPHTLPPQRRSVRAAAASRKGMVGARGFEPPTPWSRTRCSTRLSHAPTEDPALIDASSRGRSDTAGYDFKVLPATHRARAEARNGTRHTAGSTTGRPGASARLRD